jgi:hypothetical protein
MRGWLVQRPMEEAVDVALSGPGEPVSVVAGVVVTSFLSCGLPVPLRCVGMLAARSPARHTPPP